MTVRAIIRTPWVRLGGLLLAAGLSAVACGALLQATAAGEETVHLNLRIADLVSTASIQASHPARPTGR